jgi:hemerythrin-like domain-containing protein
MPSVFDVLAKDHTQVKAMLARLNKNRPGPDPGDRQLAQRKKLTEELIIEESKHEALEEMHFWPAVRDNLPDGGKLADQATSQEQDAKEMLDKLDRLDAGSSEFEKLLGEFVTAAREHIEFEETRVWPQMRKALKKKEASEIGGRIKEGKETAPTRPHSQTPAKPGVLKSGGPAVAAVDRARDAATGRGRGSGAAANGKTRAELYAEARKAGVKGRSTMTKDELARHLARARGA